MRIAQIDPAAWSLPYDHALCSALARQGHEVTLFTTRFAHGSMPTPDGYEQRLWFYRNTIPLLSRRLQRAVQHPRDMLRLGRLLERSGFDIVHVQWSIRDGFDHRLWERLSMPVVFTAHNAITREQGDRADRGRSFDAFDAVVSHSDIGTRALREAGASTVWTVPHGTLDMYRTAELPDAPPVDLPDDAMLVVLPGLLRPYKGMHVLLDAWESVAAANEHAHLVIAGRPMGVDIPESLPERATILPRFMDDGEFAWLLKQADICCLPYTGIDNSGVLFGALACSTPLVLSDVGGFSELADSGAVLVEPGNAPALSRALVDLLADDAEQKRRAARLAQAASERFSWDTIAASYTELYAGLVNEDR